MATREHHIAGLADELRFRLIERRRVAAAGGDRRRGGSADEVRALVEEEAALLGPETREELAARIVRDTVGLGPLEDLLADPSVEEVMVNGPDEVYVERAGRIEAVDVRFPDEEELRNAIERILAPLGRRIDELSPMVDARLADGSRVNVVIPPLAVDGPALSIRRFGASRPGARELVERGSLSTAPVRAARAGGRRAGAASSSAAAPAPARRRCSTRSRASSTPASGSSRSRTRPSCACSSGTWCGWRAGRPASRARVR